MNATTDLFATLPSTVLLALGLEPPLPVLLPGRPCLEEQHDHAAGGIALRTFSTYDRQGRLLQEETDGGPHGLADGITDFLTTYRYDTRGRLVQRSLDVGANGSLNQEAYYRYAASGRLEQLELDWLGGHPDGVIDLTNRYVQDARGRLLQEQARGSEAAMNRNIVYEYGSRNRLSAIRIFVDGGLVELQIARFTWQADDRLVQVEYDGGQQPPDGRPEWRSRFLYDQSGRRIGEELDGNADGIPDFRKFFVFDASGRLWLETLVTASGELQLQTRYQHECLARSGAAKDGVTASFRSVEP